MKQEPPNELIGFKGHDLDFVVIGVVPPPERDFVVFELHESVIADRDSVGVSAEILKNVLGFVKGWLAVDDPLLFIQVGD